MIKKHFLNEILSPKLLAITWGFIIIFCVFIGFSIRGKCASGGGSLPYRVNNDLVPFTFEECVNDFFVRYPNGIYTGGPTKEQLLNCQNYILVCQDKAQNGNIYYKYHILLDDTAIQTSISNNDYDNFQIGSDSLSITLLGYGTNLGKYVTLSYTYYANFGEYRSSGSGYNNNATLVFLNGNNYTNFPEQLKAPVYWGNDNKEVLTPFAPYVIPNGHATPPDLTGDDIGNDKPDIDDYLPIIPNIPTLDNSSLEKIAESIFNILQWGFNALKGTISGLFEYLGDLLSYSFQKVIDNIKNAIQNLYENFVSLFEPVLNGIAELLNSISQKLDYISQPFDSQALQETFENTAISGDIDSISQLNEQAFGTWSTTEEPNEFKIALHTEQIPLADNVNFTTATQYIDLGVINGAKPYIRGVMWCLLTFSLLYTIIDSIPNYIGGNDE